MNSLKSFNSYKFSMIGQEKVTFKYRLLLSRGDYMDKFDCNFIAVMNFVDIDIYF